MKIVKKTVPVAWYCSAEPIYNRTPPRDENECHSYPSLDKTYYASSDAIYLEGVGWVCDCGRWVKGDDRYHNIISYGKRKVYQQEAQ